MWWDSRGWGFPLSTCCWLAPHRDLNCVRHESHVHLGGPGGCAAEQRAGGEAEPAYQDHHGYTAPSHRPLPCPSLPLSVEWDTS